MSEFRDKLNEEVDEIIKQNDKDLDTLKREYEENLRKENRKRIIIAFSCIFDCIALFLWKIH